MRYLKPLAAGIAGSLTAIVALIVASLSFATGEGSSMLAVVVSSSGVLGAALVGFVAGFFLMQRRQRRLGARR